jgi:indole-3-glycerol phosphate synthase
MIGAAMVASAWFGFTAPGLLEGLVAQKRREVERLRLQPEAREDGSWTLRLSYPASKATYHLASSLGWRRQKMAVLADLKRTAPGRKLGEVETVAETLAVPLAVDAAIEQGLAGVLIAIDKTCYGGSPGDLLDVRKRVDAAFDLSGERMPVIAKDIIVDPLQIARAASLGADAVLLIVAACTPDFSLLLDTCTIMGIEALVEVHTPDEVCSGGPRRTGAPGAGGHSISSP